MDESNRYWLQRDFVIDLLKQLPAHVFWKDRNSIYLGCNDAFAKVFGFSSTDEIIGKSDYDLPVKKEQSDAFRQDDQQVMESRTPKLNIEEEQIFPDGRHVFLITSKVPLLNQNNEVMGILGIYYDITELKKTQEELVKLKLENEIQKEFIKVKEKFTNLANQVVHDIRSPLASLLMIVKSCTAIPEQDRIALREAAISIGDIANHLLSHYQKKEVDVKDIEQRQPLLVSVTLLQLLTDKKYQYGDTKIQFDYEFTSDSYFAFIKIEPGAFKRMLSNLINNAVDAFEGGRGKIVLKLDFNNEWVKLTVQDNGKGMPIELVTKIQEHVAFSFGKESGHGIGLVQVHETLERNQGELTISSQIGKGTKILLIFPRMKAPNWIAEDISLGKNDIVIILDDDVSIHRAWKARFELILKKAPNIQLKHFQIATEALSYIDQLSAAEKQRVFLLTDYELLKQELNGLHVVAKGKIQRSVLVTSHSANLLVQKQAAKTGTKILPKQLASEIPIQISEAELKPEESSIKLVDGIIVDDDEVFVDNLLLFVFEDRNIDRFHNPEYFLQNVTKYPKETKIYLDNNYETSSLKGMAIAKQLHDLGYQCIYILSGESFIKEEIPDYVKILAKNDLESIKNT